MEQDQDIDACRELPATGQQAEALSVISRPQVQEKGEAVEDRLMVSSRDADVSDLGPAELTRSQPVLVRLDGADTGQVVSLVGERLQMGRHPCNEVTINDRGVSRIHARIYQQDRTHWIEDLGSTNGTFVQGQRVGHCSLQYGDVIRLGLGVSFRYAIVDQRQEELLRQMYRSSTRDPLTGVYNRQQLTARMESEVTYALRFESSIAVAVFDIDHLKRINETHGRLAGDRVLCHVADTISRCLPNEGVAARYGDEEFVALLRDADVGAAYQMAERTRIIISEQPALVHETPIPVTISAGCAAMDSAHEGAPEALLDVANRRLYVAKLTGRNRVVWFE